METIRPAELTDLPAIVRIYNQAVSHTVATFDTEPRTVEDRLDWFRQHNDRFVLIVAQLGQEVRGWACLSRYSERLGYKDTCEVSLYIDEACRGQGMGTRLFDAVLSLARKNRFHTVLSRVTGGNSISAHLHEKFGFALVGTMKEAGFKFGRFLDVDIYQLLL